MDADGQKLNTSSNDVGENLVQAQLEANERARQMFEAGRGTGDEMDGGKETGKVPVSNDGKATDELPNGSIIGGKAGNKKHKANRAAMAEPRGMAEINLAWKRSAVGKFLKENKKVLSGVGAGMGVLVLLLAGVATVTILNRKDEVLEPTYEEVRAKIMDNEEEYTYDDAISSYEKALERGDDEWEGEEELTSILSSLYAARAGEAYNLLENGGGNNDGICFAQILADAYEAERLNPTVETAYNIYIYESSFGNIERAFEYLDIAEERGLLSSGGEG